jgi:hypothetical protein
MSLFVLLLACADDEPAWVVQHASVVPSTNGLTGTQTWEFFSAAWAPDKGDQGYLCARAQTIEASVTTDGDCAECRAVYALAVTELGSDCPDDLVADPGFGGPAVFAIGDVKPDFEVDDPYPGQSFGWWERFGDESLTAVGYAWPEALEADPTASTGWSPDRPYTLWPAIAWQL